MKYLLTVSLGILLGLNSCKKISDDCVNPLVKNTKFSCEEIYSPVCGCDGKTYGNECIAKNEGGVTKWTKGPCN